RFKDHTDQNWFPVLESIRDLVSLAATRPRQNASKPHMTLLKHKTGRGLIDYFSVPTELSSATSDRWKCALSTLPTAPRHCPRSSFKYNRLSSASLPLPSSTDAAV